MRRPRLRQESRPLPKIGGRVASGVCGEPLAAISVLAEPVDGCSSRCARPDCARGGGRAHGCARRRDAGGKAGSSGTAVTARAEPLMHVKGGEFIDYID